MFQVVAEASDGHEAIELAAAHEPDVILLDVGMPRLSGTDARNSRDADVKQVGNFTIITRAG
jgi:YesN/AraC family two-component response regulator